MSSTARQHEPDSGAAAGGTVASMAELNALFTAGVEQVDHHRVPYATHQAHLARFLPSGPPAPPRAPRPGRHFLGR